MKVEIDISNMLNYEDDYVAIAYKISKPIIKKFEAYLFKRYGSGLGRAGELAIRDYIERKMRLIAEVKVSMKELDKLLDRR